MGGGRGKEDLIYEPTLHKKILTSKLKFKKSLTVSDCHLIAVM